MKNIKLKLPKGRKKTLLIIISMFLAVCICLSIISYVKSSKSQEIYEKGARIVIDCGIRVGFVVDEDFVVSEIYACNKKYEKYIKEIEYETDFVIAATHVFNAALEASLMYNVDYCVVLASIESKNPEMYARAYTELNDNVKEDGIGMDRICYAGIAITEYDSEIQKIAKRNRVPYSVAYVCTELEKANEGLSAKKLMKYDIHTLSQLANNANGKDKDYFYNFLAELSQKNLAKLK